MPLNKLKTVYHNFLTGKKYNQLSCFFPGHFYSPIVSEDDLESIRLQSKENGYPHHIQSVNLNSSGQVSLLTSILEKAQSYKFHKDPTKGYRYYYNNGFFSITDALLLYGVLTLKKPHRVIEVGSGFSSALMLDIKDQEKGDPVQFTFIEPYPERLKKLLSRSDLNTVTLLQEKVQHIPMDHFTGLQENDILFIDSSHISKAGSDLNFLLFEVMPTLSSGVLIHFHDVFYPFEYPIEWINEGRNWNENYLIRAFLMNNADYEILLFAHYLHTKHPEAFSGYPQYRENTGGSLWLRKL